MPPLRTNGQVGTGQVSRVEPVPREGAGGISKGSEELMGACETILLPRGKAEITVCMERSPPRGWLDMLGGAGPPLVINSNVCCAILGREI